MFADDEKSLIYFLLLCTFLILLMICLIAYFITTYKKRQLSYINQIEILQVTFKSTLLQSQLEMQEQTFQNISREIHDNIGQKLSLAKLQLNKMNLPDNNDPVQLIGQAIDDLRDLSRSMSSEFLIENGLIKALELEVNHLCKVQSFNIILKITGEPIHLEGNQELIIFRIAQEAMHNILKHASASSIHIALHYQIEYLELEIKDDGVGFAQRNTEKGLGLDNMRKRAEMLKGQFSLTSITGEGTIVKIKIPYHG